MTEYVCRCGAPAEVLATDQPDQVAMMEFGDREAQVPFCLTCIVRELDDPHSPWVSIDALPGVSLEPLMRVEDGGTGEQITVGIVVDGYDLAVAYGEAA